MCEIANYKKNLGETFIDIDDKFANIKIHLASYIYLGWKASNIQRLSNRASALRRVQCTRCNYHKRTWRQTTCISPDADRRSAQSRSRWAGWERVHRGSRDATKKLSAVERKTWRRRWRQPRRKSLEIEVSWARLVLDRRVITRPAWRADDIERARADRRDPPSLSLPPLATAILFVPLRGLPPIRPSVSPFASSSSRIQPITVASTPRRIPKS